MVVAITYTLVQFYDQLMTSNTEQALNMIKSLLIFNRYFLLEAALLIDF
jgi:hypothetical protein